MEKVILQIEPYARMFLSFVSVVICVCRAVVFGWFEVTGCDLLIKVGDVTGCELL